jgi:DNA invertase Pin-like site-specific DNA recombinase
MELGYARVSTAKQDLDRQIDALTEAGIPAERIYLDKKSGSTTDRPGLRAVLEYARDGDVIVVHTLDRLGRTVRDTLNLIHDLSERGVGIRNLADPIRIDSSNPADPMAQLAVVLLALFAQMERTYTVERAAHARAVATAKGRRVGRPSVVDPDKLAYAGHLRDAGHTLAEIVAKTGITRSSLYRHLPPRPADTYTAAPTPTPELVAPTPEVIPPSRSFGKRPPARATNHFLESVTWPDGYAPPCPRCHQPTTGLQEKPGRAHGETVIRAVAVPCSCAVDEHAAALQNSSPTEHAGST